MVAFVRAGPSAFAAQPPDPLRCCAMRANRPVAPEARLYEAIGGLFITEAKKEIRSHNKNLRFARYRHSQLSDASPSLPGSDQCCHPKRKCHLSYVSVRNRLTATCKRNPILVVIKGLPWRPHTS
jgi:hypothetical protein